MKGKLAANSPWAITERLIADLYKRVRQLEARIPPTSARAQRSITASHVDVKGRLVLTFADGSEEVAGRVKPTVS